MAWIESHTVLVRHRKLLEVSFDLQIPPVYVVGHLHALWHAALEQQEDGDLSRWSDEHIATAAQFPGSPKLFVETLKERGWINKNGLIHDWLDYAGRYLTGKYRTSNPKRLKEIYKKHKTVLSQSKDTLKTDNLPNQPYLPNLTKPTIEDAHNFFVEKKSTNEEADAFFNYYESQGWRVGRNPMKNWKAAAAGWLSRKKQFGGRPLPVTPPKHQEENISTKIEKWKREAVPPPPGAIDGLIKNLSTKMGVA